MEWKKNVHRTIHAASSSSSPSSLHLVEKDHHYRNRHRHHHQHHLCIFLEKDRFWKWGILKLDTEEEKEHGHDHDHDHDHNHDCDHQQHQQQRSCTRLPRLKSTRTGRVCAASKGETFWQWKFLRFSHLRVQATTQSPFCCANPRRCSLNSLFSKLDR